MDLKGILRVQCPMRGNHEMVFHHLWQSRGPTEYNQVIYSPVEISCISGLQSCRNIMVVLGNVIGIMKLSPECGFKRYFEGPRPDERGL